MRILHVASGREWRGGQRQVLQLAAGLASVPGIRSDVVTGRDSVLASRLMSSGTPVHPVTWTIGVDPRVIAAVVRRADRDTIIHAHDSHAHAIADIASRFTASRVIATRRVDLPIRHPKRWRRAAAAIALSRAIERRLLAIGVDASRVHVVPPGIASPDAAPAWPATVPPPRPAERYVTCIAALTAEKGVDVLIDAAPAILAVHADVRFVIVGDGPERPRLEARVNALGIGNKVLFAGWTENPENVLARTVVAVQPSRSEGFGSSVLDALARGVPVVASATGGLPDALASGGGVTVAPGDATALAGAIAGLLADPARRELLGDEGRAAAARFSIERLVAATLDVYRSA